VSDSLHSTVLRRIGFTLPGAARRLELLGLGGAALLLTLLALNELGRQSFWRDEIASVLFASAPVEELVRIVGRDRAVADVPFMAVYTLLLHFWLKVAETEAQIRFLSLVAGVATTVPVYFIGRRFGGWPAGILAALVFATLPSVIEWSQEARSYSLAMFVSATATVLLLRSLERPTVLRWLTYGLVAAVGLYVHSFVALVLVAHAGYVLLTRSWPALGPLMAAAIPLGLAVLPFPFLFGEYGGKYGWIPSLTLGSIQRTLTVLAGGLPVLVAMIALGVLAAVSHRSDRRVWLILAAALVPIVAAIVISVVRPILLPRYLVVSLPFIAILAGVGLASIRPMAWRVGAIGLVSVLLVFAIPWAYRDSHQQDWRSAGGWIAGSARPGDAVVAWPWGQPHLGYYLRRAESGTLPKSVGFRTAMSGEPADRLWVVLTGLSDREEKSIIKQMSGGGRYEQQEEREFGSRVTVVLLTQAE
jgi:mannosyltransferase